MLTERSDDVCLYLSRYDAVRGYFCRC